MNKKNLIIITMLIASAIYFSGTAALACDDYCGCTLTPGYWKTHSKYGPAPYDATWNGMEDNPFWRSGQTAYQVINTPRKKGNAYYILAFQYIAAYLNNYNGAWVPEDVWDALHCADAFFANHTPSDSLSLPEEERAAAIACASILADYNEGIIGPGHCDD
jgi:hypothetical protein